MTLTAPHDLEASATIDVPPEVIEVAREHSHLDMELCPPARLETWLINHTSYEVTVTVDGEPLAEYLDDERE